MQSGIIHQKQDLTFLNWSKIRHSSGTAGSFLKATTELSGTKIYYKLSNYDRINGIIGHESVNELIADRLLTVLGIEHVPYQLIHADILLDDRIQETWVCASENFRRQGEDKVAIDVMFEREHHDNEGPLQYCVRKGWGSYIWQMLVVDFLILNRDRHGANIEILRDKKRKTLRIAPLFDQGLSLLCRCDTQEKIRRFDVMEDLPVQCFVGTRSAFENLNLIPADQRPLLNELKQKDKETILEGLDDVIPTILQERIWEMIWKRWCYYQDLSHKRHDRSDV